MGLLNRARNYLYYLIKPIIPRFLQVKARRLYCRLLLNTCRSVWPVDDRASCPPKGFSGWPKDKEFAFMLMHDVDTQKGHDRVLKLMEMEMERGIRSVFNFVPERYTIDPSIFDKLRSNGFGIGVHGLNHDGKLFRDYNTFKIRSVKINRYLRDWGTEGFSSPAMHHRTEWMHNLDIRYGTTTFDTDPFEPQPNPAGTVFPFFIKNNNKRYLEIPYTLPQDFTLFCILGEETNRYWERKLEWICSVKGMALLNTHPDYMEFNNRQNILGEYPVSYYESFLEWVKGEYSERYWHSLPCELADYWYENIGN